jgi:Mg2+ and Co2+ transporter CorA
MSVRVYLYDATGTDQEIALTEPLVAGLHDQQLLWVDILAPQAEELNRVAALLSLRPESVARLLEVQTRPRLDNYGTYFQLTIDTIEALEKAYRIGELKFVVGCNFLVTIHHQPVAFLNSFDSRVQGDSGLGQLDAPAFLAALLDWHITSYFRLIEQLEAQLDKLDVRALRPRHGHDLLADLANMRPRLAFLRRILAPHREVYAALVRPDFLALAGSNSATHYGLLHQRLEQAIEALENARELLIGSFEIFTTQTALRTNEVMKALTLASFIWFPASVIVGIAGLLLKTPIYPIGAGGFWLMLALIGLIGITTLIVARWRHWI